MAPGHHYSHKPAAIFGGLLALAIVLLLTKNPTDRVHLDYNGGAQLEIIDWWGMSREWLPMKVISGEWHYKHRGKWWPYQIEPDVE